MWSRSLAPLLPLGISALSKEKSCRFCSLPLCSVFHLGSFRSVGACVRSPSVVSHSCNPMDCSPGQASLSHRTLQAILEWVAISFQRTFQSKDRILRSPTREGLFIVWSPQDALRLERLQIILILASTTLTT